MGARGRAAAPTRLKLLNGTQASRINLDEPVAINRPPVCPEDVSDAVRAVWEYTVAELVAMDLARSADRDSLRCYCEAVVAHRLAAQGFAKSSVLIEGRDGGLVRNPVLAIMRDNANLIRVFAHEFGLTPSARSGLTAIAKAIDAEFNPFDAASSG